MKVYVVGQTRPEKPDGVDFWDFQGVFSTLDQAQAACRNDRYFVWDAEVDEVLPDEPIVWDKDLSKQGFWQDENTPKFSPETKALVDRMFNEERFNGGQLDAQGNTTPDAVKPSAERFRRYYPAYCAFAWAHDAAKFWALVAHLHSVGADANIITEVEAMARYAYETGWAWGRAAMSGDPQYDSWLEPPEGVLQASEPEAIERRP